jgi:hypothetical protein
MVLSFSLQPEPSLTVRDTVFPVSHTECYGPLVCDKNPEWSHRMSKVSKKSASKGQ